MDIFEAIENRRSIRKFIEKPITEEMLRKLMDAIKFAPSAGNLHSRFFHVVHNSEIKKKLCVAANNQKFVEQAPVVFVGSMHLERAKGYGSRGTELYSIQDVSASVQNLMLVAHSLGLGTCWVGAFTEKEAAEVLDLPDFMRPIAMVPVGYPDISPKARKTPTEDEMFKQIL